MALSTGKKNSGTSGVGVSLQSQILEHFLDSMADVRATLSNKDEKDSKKRMESFRLQILYLRKLVPDRGRQQKIKAAIDAAKTQYQKDKSFTGEDLVEYASQLETITEVMVYLNEGMNLIHHDIPAPLTERALQHAREAQQKPLIQEPIADNPEGAMS